MAYILNPKYNPNDVNSQRYVLQADNPNSTPALNMSVLPAATPIPSGPMSPAPAANSSKPNYSPAPAPTPTLNDNPYLPKLMPTTDTTNHTTSPTNIPTPVPVIPTTPVPPPAPIPTYTPPSGGNDGYIPGLDQAQKQSIVNLVATGRPFSETDAKNYAYATGAGDYTQFIGKTGAQITGVGSQGGSANDGTTGGGAPINPNPNPNNPGGMSDQDLAAAAGRAGLSVSDFVMAYGQANPQTADQSQAIRNKLGIPDLVDKTFAQPSQNTVDAYNELYNLSGLDTVKTKIAAIDDDINKKRQDLITATGELQNNPWLSQASRTGRLKILTQLAEADINNSLQARQQYMDQYNTGVSKVEEAVNRKVNDQKTEQGLNVDKLNYLLTQAEQQDKLAANKTTSQALRYLPDYLTAKGETGKQYPTGVIGEYQYYADQEKKAGRTPMSFNDYQNTDANRKAKVAQITAGGLTTAQQNAAFKLSDDYEKASGDFGKVVSNYNRIQAAAKDPSPAGDLAMIFSYMKVLDPTSVVREGEFATAANAGGVGDKVINQYNSIINGKRLSAAQRTDFLNRSASLYQAAVSQQKQVDDTFTSRANQYGIPPSFVVRDQNSFSTPAKPTLQTYYQQNPTKQTQINTLVNQGLSDDDIMQIVGAGTFSQPPSTGEKGSLAVADNRRNPSKVINGYDFTNYATDPNWGNGVKTILNKIPPLTNAAQVGAYIAQVAPKSPLVAHGDTIVRIAQSKGIAPQLLLAIMQQESNFGTLGRAASTHNPANVGNVDSGANVDWGSWERGVQALADNIAKRTIA